MLFSIKSLKGCLLFFLSFYTKSYRYVHIICLDIQKYLIKKIVCNDVINAVCELSDAMSGTRSSCIQVNPVYRSCSQIDRAQIFCSKSIEKDIDKINVILIMLTIGRWLVRHLSVEIGTIKYQEVNKLWDSCHSRWSISQWKTRFKVFEKYGVHLICHVFSLLLNNLYMCLIISYVWVHMFELLIIYYIWSIWGCADFIII